MNYEIIKDMDLLKAFIDWLPELRREETYYLALFARKKYCAHIKNIKTDKAQCKRFTSTKEKMLHKIRQLECPLGSYEIKGVEIPQEALALYISVNPRNMHLATKGALIQLATLLTQDYNGYNPHQEVMSELHRSKGKTRYVDFDFDGVELEPTVAKILQIVNREAVTVLKTKAGFHVLIVPQLVAKREIPGHILPTTPNWYKGIAALPGVDVRGDNLIPVVGCTQGNFVPYFVEL